MVLGPSLASPEYNVSRQYFKRHAVRNAMFLCAPQPSKGIIDHCKASWTGVRTFLCLRLRRDGAGSLHLRPRVLSEKDLRRRPVLVVVELLEARKRKGNYR